MPDIVFIMKVTHLALVGLFTKDSFASVASDNYDPNMESAEAIVADVDSKRSVTIEIFNRCNNWCLLNPR